MFCFRSVSIVVGLIFTVSGVYVVFEVDDIIYGRLVNFKTIIIRIIIIILLDLKFYSNQPVSFPFISFKIW